MAGGICTVGKTCRDLVNSCATMFNDTPLDSLSYTYDALSRPTARNADTFAYNDRSEVVSAQLVRDKQTDLLTPNGVRDSEEVSGVSREQIRLSNSFSPQRRHQRLRPQRP